MESFTGEYSHSIDDKGRIAIPARFREALGERFMVTKGLDGCLFVFPMEAWKEFEEKLLAIPMLGRDNRKLVRHFLSGAQPVVPDKLGRILLPASLREYGALEKDVVTIGMGRRLEIWSGEAWEKESGFDDMEEVEARMVELGIVF